MKSQVLKVNPHYVARLISPVAMASDMDQHMDIFESLDFDSKDHVNLLISEVIQHEYLRLSEDSRSSTKESLRYILNAEPGGAVSQICSMLGLSDEEIPTFLNQIWKTMFPSESEMLLKNCKYVKNSAPLKFNEVHFGDVPSRTLNESFEALRKRLNM